MPIHANLYMHPLDRTALNSLKSIPGFSQLLKAWMKIWSEQQFLVENMATHLRVSEKQLPELYAMLPPICSRLGIAVPELYLKLDGQPNAYTSGDTNPFIVLTSGLVEKFPKELIPAVLAHECGHIACHHVLYTTMGDIMLGTTAKVLGVSELMTYPIQAAFSYWMRCSELSADRAAAICCGGSDQVVEYCMRFAGFPAKMPVQGNREVFMEQAEDYLQSRENSAWNKVLETLMYSQTDHPLNAVRAHECHQWCAGGDFQKLLHYTLALEQGSSDGSDVYCPLPEDASAYLHRDSQEVIGELNALGFRQIRAVRAITPDVRFKLGQIVALVIDGAANAARGSFHSQNVPIEVHYYHPLSEAELIAAHPGQVRTPFASAGIKGKFYREALLQMQSAGFTNVQVQEHPEATRNWFAVDKSVTQVTIAGQDLFEKGAWFYPNAPVVIHYRTFPER